MNTITFVRKCENCDDWEEGIEQIVGLQLFCFNQSAAPKADVKAFRYCPWCGTHLKLLEE